MLKNIFKIFINIVLIIAIISTGINVAKQFMTLKEARNKNIYLSEQLIDFEKNNKDLLRKIEYATTSAFLEQQSRIILGMGTNSDYWITEQIDSDINLYPQVENKKEEANIIKWIRLFTN